jgi:hypothetical protein
MFNITRLRESFQTHVRSWMASTYGDHLTNDPVEHNHRFFLESLKFFRACGGTKEQALILMERANEETGSDVGELAVALAASCNAQGLSLQERAEQVLHELRGRERCYPISHANDRLRSNDDVDVSTGFGEHELDSHLPTFYMARDTYERNKA